MQFRYALALLALAIPVSAQDRKQIELGRYLVENIGQCGVCHSPKNDKGDLDKSKWMKGTILDFQPLGTAPAKWHKTSPDLTPGGKLWTKWGEGALLKYLQTGLGPSGKPADPPMPMYKYSAEHAEAVLAYLKSLK
jgi:mono/diheme cytochrome c family protein